MFKSWRRRRVLARQSIPDDLWKGALAASPVLARLPPPQLERLRETALLFLHEKRFEPAVGYAIDERMRVRIAALAALPILELGLDYYQNFVSIVLHPDEFVVRDREIVDEDGVVHTGDDLLSGEAWEQGPVILAWAEVEESGRGEGYNVVAHELAHKIDMLSGEADGAPPLHSGMRLAEWTAAFDDAYEHLLDELDRGKDPWLDPYAAEDRAEFFAVCSEMFFDVPKRFAREYPDVYAQLAAFYKQDPAKRR
ncbi:MAG TPA: M90 family metallopeptidase [Gammaproteobacteria bacterium]|nr:M90 family metallopeptidase [Gammaproteobacteria bacterium]